MTHWIELLSTPGGGAVAILLCAGLIYATRWQRRLGWLGIPVGTAMGVVALFQSIGLILSGYWDLMPLLAGALIAGILGWRLPRPDSWIALPAAPAIAYAFSFALTGGADNPLPLYLAAATLFFMIGAAASAMTETVRSRRLRKAAANV